MTVRRKSSRHREAIEREWGKPVEEIVADLRTGWLRLTDKQVAARLQVSRSTVNRWRGEDGVPQEPSPAPPDPPARAPVPLERAALSLVTQRAAAECAPSQEAESVA